MLSIDPRELKLLDKNARRMNAKQFTQLVDNVRRDGVLTSVPLVWLDPDSERYQVLSGNHRTKAAVAAGLGAINVLVVAGDLSDARRTAIQLSHNAITGDDDQNILQELYESLDVLEQRYSGLTDQTFGLLEDLDLSKLSLGAPAYQQVNLMFLPEDREVFVDAMEKLGKAGAKAKRYVAPLALFEQFEATLVTVSDTLDIRNQALAVLMMAELALERLQQMKDEQGGRSTTTATREADEDGSAERAAGVGGDHVGSSGEAAG